MGVAAVTLGAVGRHPAPQIAWPGPPIQAAAGPAAPAAAAWGGRDDRNDRGGRARLADAAPPPLALPFAARRLDRDGLPPAPTAPPPPTATASPSSPPTATPTPWPTTPPATGTPPPPTATPDVAVDGQRVTTAHYDLIVEPLDGEALDGLDGRVIGRLLEAAYPQLAAHFGAVPDGRLPGKIFASAAAMAAGMAADGLHYGGGGGYYHPANRTFYAFAQPSAYFTRMLILHEATHQFHYLSATGNWGYSGFWYGEGLAEHFGMHRWDGTTLATGVIPAISLEDYPAQALAEFDARDRDLAALVADRGGWSRPSGWGVVSWLLDERPAGAKALFARLDRRDDPVASWTAVFGPVTAADAAAYRAWLVRHPQPWREVWRAFEARGDVLVGRSGVNALAVRKAPVDGSPAAADGAADGLAVSLEPLSGPLRAGLVVGFTDAQHFVVVQLLASRDVWAFRMTPTGWQWLAGARAADPPPDADGGPARDGLAARRAERGGWTVAVNGADVITVPDEGLLGLNVDGCAVAFRVVDASGAGR